MGVHSRSRLEGSLLCLAAAVGLSLGLAAHAAEPGVWKSHQITFNYLGGEPTYSCDGLRQDLRALLRMSGARLDGPISAGPCFGGEGQPSKLLSARLKFSTLQPADASAGSTTSAAGPIVPGDWHQVTFAPNHPVDVLSGGDCELVQEFQEKVLSQFATRNVKANLQCVPFQTIGYFFNLTFEVFAPSSAAPGAEGH